MEFLPGLVIAYVLVCVAGYFLERVFMYFPDPERVPPAAAGLAGVDELEISGADGETLVAWYAKARDGKPTLLYFHGNAGNAAGRAERVATYAGAGYGILLMNYRGFGGSSGRPSEAANVADAEAAYAYLIAQGLSGDDIVLYGESIGTGVAVRLALSQPVRAVVLDAPLTSTVDVARRTYWFLPLRLIMTDQYRNIDRIGSLTVPLLILHGARDRVTPVAQGRRLYEAATTSKSMEIFPEGGHSDLYEHGAWDKIRAFLEALPR